MKAATVYDIKEALQALAPAQVTELCLRLVKFKKENKELVSYLLFDAHQLQAYLAGIKAEMETEFAGINSSQVYFAKKSLRRILRNTNKQSRYIADKAAEVELLLAYCQNLKASGLATKKAPVIEKIYLGQISKIKKLIGSLHEDLQYDYLRLLDKITAS
ncbi:hypothetical protein [Flavihumibacter fluvii]|uniref:hypothetical protein n=1 Tax=Flavihumibacter fluvii TaxID=2838157 RepID=UPI001BDE1E4B|nr:hypothetical protein [Flavihumibacter fluvii]ULQ52040.1 hypothetical protein KJS93_18265 [Flavihumibacter fluvii]